MTGLPQCQYVAYFNWLLHASGTLFDHLVLLILFGWFWYLIPHNNMSNVLCHSAIRIRPNTLQNYSYSAELFKITIWYTPNWYITIFAHYEISFPWKLLSHDTKSSSRHCICRGDMLTVRRANGYPNLMYTNLSAIVKIASLVLSVINLIRIIDELTQPTIPEQPNHSLLFRLWSHLTTAEKRNRRFLSIHAL